MEIRKFRELRKQNFPVVDVREPELFAEGFIPGSLNIPLNVIENGWDELFLMKDMSLIITGEEKHRESALNIFQDKGFEEVKGFFADGFHQWLQEGNDPDMVIRVTPEELKLDVKHDQDARIIDIRPKDSFDYSHVQKAINIPAEEIFSNWQELPLDKPNFIYGQDDASSMIIISWLKLQGRHNFYQVAGSIEELKKEDVPFSGSEEKNKSSR